MGEVYKALDPTLGRPVALKVLRRELSGDPERLSRFLHEARAASALNHPNILTIHEVGDHDRSRFLVSEFVEGETVRQRLERGPLTLARDSRHRHPDRVGACRGARRLDRAPRHQARQPDAAARRLRQGARLRRRDVRASGGRLRRRDDDHRGHRRDERGQIVGTIAYMSPEQARGLPVDGRSDCYSLGVVLYELVTGRAPFAAPTTSDLLVAILEREPPSLRLAARALPPQLEWIIEKALEKDPNLRYQTIADLRVDLQRLKAALESGRMTGPVPVTEGAGRRCTARAPPDRRQPGGRRRSAGCRGVSAALGALAIGRADRGDVLLPPGAARRRTAAPTAHTAR